MAKMNKTAITAITLSAILGAGSIGGLAYSRYMGSHKTTAQSTYAANDDTVTELGETDSTSADAKAAAEEAKTAAEQAAQAQKAAEEALKQATTERIAAEQAAAQASAEQKATAQKVAEQKAAEEKAAQEKAAEAKKAAEQKAAEQKKAQEAQAAAEKRAAEQKKKQQTAVVSNWSAKFFYTDGSAMTVSHYTNGQLIGSNGIKYTDNGHGVLLGSDGSRLFSTKAAALATGKKESQKTTKKVVVNWSANFYYTNGNAVRVDHYTNGQFISEEGIEYTDNGHGLLIGTDGSRLFSTKGAADATAKQEYAKANTVNWSATFFYTNGNGVRVDHYTNGKFISEEGIEYTDNGHGVLTGTDGSKLFSTKGAADATAKQEYEKANAVNWSGTFFYTNGNAVRVDHYTNGKFISEEGIEYTDNGHGVLTGTDGSTLFSTKEAADATAKKNADDANPIDWSANYFYATSNSVKVDHYKDGRFVAETGVEYTDNGDGTLTGTDGTTLFEREEDADAYLKAQKEAADQKAAEEKAAQEKAEAEKKAAEEKAAQEKAEAEKKAAEEKAAQAQAEAEKKAAEEKAAEEKAEAERAQKESEEAQKRAEEEEAQKQAEEEAQREAEEEAQREAEEEAQREAEEEAQREAEEEAQREAEEEAQREAEEEAQREAEEEAQRQAEEQAEQQAEEQAEQQAEEQAEEQAAQDDSAKAAVRSAVANALADGELSDDDIANISSVACGVSFTSGEISAMGLTTGQAQSMGINICG